MAKVIGPTEIQVEGFKVVQLLDGAVLKNLSAEFSNLKIRHICFSIEVVPDKSESVTIGHDSPKQEAASIATLTADSPLALEKLVKAVLGVDYDASRP